ncbi:MAG: hypothetical protein ACFFBH_12070 [Promethearchaeota archaeon]
MKEEKKSKKKKLHYPLSKEEFLKAFVSEFSESGSSSIIEEISKDVLNERITPEQAIDILNAQEQELRKSKSFNQKEEN